MLTMFVASRERNWVVRGQSLKRNLLTALHYTFCTFVAKVCSTYSKFKYRKRKRKSFIIGEMTGESPVSFLPIVP